jgi:hypothetical protein
VTIVFFVLIIFEIIEYRYGMSVGIFLVKYFVVVVMMEEFKFEKIRIDIKEI